MKPAGTQGLVCPQMCSFVTNNSKKGQFFENNQSESLQNNVIQSLQIIFGAALKKKYLLTEIAHLSPCRIHD
jgi:hypothetical protein